VVKNRLGGGAGELGLVLAAAGAGSLCTALVIGQLGPPRRHILVMYVAFAVAVSLTAAFAIVRATWQAMIVSVAQGAANTVGIIIWATLMQTVVPQELQGRVQSLDWLVSIALVPVSFALTGPVANTIGVESTLLLSGLIGGVGQFGFLLVPGIFATEREGVFERRRPP
jgi:MFS family permease